ncbi:MAG: amidohydrolase family protein [Planctomycetes bacterium]|nr:amidohydrolase family protein [Planctomycetota bacterium]
MSKKFLTLSLLSLVAPQAGAFQAPEKLAITGAKVITVSGETYEKANVLLENGRIQAIGKDLEIPWDAKVIDASGKVVMPGLVVAQTNEGLDRPNENVPVTPFLSVLDALNPVDAFFEDSLREGHATILVIPGNETVIGGTGRVVKPHGLTVESMTVRVDGGMKIAASPRRGVSAMAHVAELRKAFVEFRDELEVAAEKKLASAKNEKKAEAPSAAAGKADDKKADEKKPEEKKGDDKKAAEKPAPIDPLQVLEWRDLTPRQRALFEVLSGRMPVFLWCERAMDVAHAIEIAKSQGFLARTTLVIGAECWKAADEIKAAGLSVILPSDFVHREIDPLTGKERETSLPKVFAAKGIPFALNATSRGALLERSLLLRAASAVAAGVEPAVALRAITLEPARMLGLQDSHGSLEVGKAGTLLVLSGDPFRSGTWVEEVVIDGAHLYSRSKDDRLQRLTGDSKDGGR